MILGHQCVCCSARVQQITLNAKYARLKRVENAPVDSKCVHNTYYCITEVERTVHPADVIAECFLSASKYREFLPPSRVTIIDRREGALYPRRAHPVCRTGAFSREENKRRRRRRRRKTTKLVDTRGIIILCYNHYSLLFLLFIIIRRSAYRSVVLVRLINVLVGRPQVRKRRFPSGFPVRRLWRTHRSA